jgi:hypothetical protein
LRKPRSKRQAGDAAFGCGRASRGHQVDFSGVDMLDRTPVLDVKPWEQHLDIPGWPARRVESIRGGWYQRTRNIGAGGVPSAAARWSGPGC